jgi:dipeptidyl aminopeptidase/acylaminoacyl peptidase
VLSGEAVENYQATSNLKPKAKSQWLRRILIAILFIGALYIALNALTAWLFVRNLTKPVCPEPQPLPGEYTYQEHWVRTEDGIMIRIWYYPSRNRAAVLILGGLTGSLGNKIPTVETLLQAGYGIAQVDTRACSQPSALVTLGVDETLDAQAALELLKSFPEIDPDQIGVMGFSMGGSAAIRLMYHQNEVRSLVRDGGYARMSDMFQPQTGDGISEWIFRGMIGMMFNWQTGIDYKEINPINILPAISPRPILLVYGEKEAEPGFAQFEAAMEPKTLWIVPGGTHGKNHLIAPQAYQEKILNFFNHTLLGIGQQ